MRKRDHNIEFRFFRLICFVFFSVCRGYRCRSYGTTEYTEGAKKTEKIIHAELAEPAEKSIIKTDRSSPCVLGELCVKLLLTL